MVQYNYLSISVMTLALLLIKLSVVGFCSSHYIEKNQSEEVRASRQSVSQGYMFMVCYLKLTIIMFCIFLYSTIWFMFFNQGPVSWMETMYFHKGTNETIKAQYKSVDIDLVSGNIRLILVALGMFCGLITFILYVNMQLMKKLLRRMERINTLIEQQCTVLAVFSCVLVYNMQHFINFDSMNASEVLTENIPYHYHNRFFIAGFFLLFISIFSYFAAFYEVNLMFSVNTLLSSIAIIVMIVLSITNEVTSSMIAEKIDDKCLFILPEFSQDFLMERGCESKYTSFEVNLQDMSCPKEEVTRIWEDN